MVVETDEREINNGGTKIELLQDGGGNDDEMTLDDILLKLGRPGFYHVVNTFILLLVLAFVVNHYITLSATIGIVPRYYNCKVSHQYQSKLAISMNTSLDDLIFGKCHVSLRYNDSKQIPCESWTYEFTEEEGDIDSIVTKWDLVCDRKFYPQLSNTLFFVGLTISGATLSHLSDQYGRRPILILFLLLSIIASVGTAFSQHLIVFMVMRVVLAISMCVVHGTINISIVELYPTKYNNLIGTIVLSSFLILLTFGNLIGWLVKSWWNAQLIFSLPILLPLVCAYFLLPESYRWLLIHDKMEEAKRYLLKAARINHVKLPDFTTIRNNVSGKKDASKEVKKIKFRSILKHKEMRKRFFSVLFLWVALSMSFYALALNVKNLSSNPYLSTLISSIADCAPILSTFLLMPRLGKRNIMCIYLFIGGTFSIVYKFYNHIAIMMIGKMFCGISFGLLYLYSMDIFPTVFRTTCLGICVTVSRIGTLLAPQLIILGTYTSPDIPVLITGIMLLLGAITMYFLPDTSNMPLPDRVEDVENYKQIKKDMELLIKAKALHNSIAVREHNNKCMTENYF